jgi:hypothetical protein
MVFIFRLFFCVHFSGQLSCFCIKLSDRYLFTNITPLSRVKWSSPNSITVYIL